MMIIMMMMNVCISFAIFQRCFNFLSPDYQITNKNNNNWGLVSMSSENNQSEYSHTSGGDDFNQAQMPESLIVVSRDQTDNQPHKQSIFLESQRTARPIQDHQQQFRQIKNSKSRDRLVQLKEQEKYLSATFKIQNFYNQQHHQLNLQNLKKKINEIKPRKGYQGDPPHNNALEGTGKNQMNSRNRYRNNMHRETLIPLNRKLMETKNKNQAYEQTVTSFYEIDKPPSTHRSNNYSTLAQRSTARTKYPVNQSGQARKSVEHEQKTELVTLPYNPQVKSRNQRQSTAKSSIIPKISSIGHRKKNTKLQQKEKQLKPKRYGSVFETNNQQLSPKQNNPNTFINSRLQPIIRKNITKKQISEPQKLLQFEANVSSIWLIYENLSSIVNYLSPPNGERAHTSDNDLVCSEFMEMLTNYKQLVCSNRVQFLMVVAENCLEIRQSKTIIQSRLLENLSIIYIFFHIAERFLEGHSNETSKKNRLKIDLSHLVNFVGICSRNLLLVLRLLTLTHIISRSLCLSEETSEIFDAIEQYEQQSYNGVLVSTKDTLLRIDHNNQLASIIHNKLNYKLKDKDLHKKCIHQFLRGVVIDGLKGYYRNRNTSSYNLALTQTQNQPYKPLFEYSFYIFEYLAYHLHNEQCIGLFPEEIETAPQPYLSIGDFPSVNPQIKQFSVIINPKNTMIYDQKGKQKVFIRAHTQYFLSQLSKKCNIILWSDQMPNLVDPYFDLLENKSQSYKIYRLYEHHCVYGIKSHKANNKKKFKNRNNQNDNNLVLIKDISRIPLPQNKYILIDEGQKDSYFEHEMDHLIDMSWSGNPYDNGLKILADSLYPILREGINLAMGINLMRNRLESALRDDRQHKSLHKKQYKRH